MFSPILRKWLFCKTKKKGEILNTSAAGGAGALAAGVSGWPEKKNAYFSYLCILFSVKSIDVFICMICELTGLNAVFRLLNVHGGIAYCLLKISI